MDYLNRLDLIEFIVEWSDRVVEGDFGEEMLYEELAEASNEELLEMAEAYGWC